MKEQPRTKLIYRLQSIILLVFYTISMLALFIPLARGVAVLFPDHLYPFIVFSLLYVVLMVVAGGYLYTFSSIPSQLAAAFDPIKNGIASGEIRSLEVLGKNLSHFTVAFFNFAFLDINHAYLHTPTGGIHSNEDMKGLEVAMQQFGMLEMSRSLEEISRAGKVDHAGSSYHLYVLPIWFGNTWLGYMGLLSGRRIGRLAQRFLMEYENNFLDDQIMHVVPKEPAA
jgi:hypothetical protein